MAEADALDSLLDSLLWNAASRRLPPPLAGQLIVFKTLFALLCSFLYLQRLPTALETLAIGLMIGGLMWVVRPHVPEREEGRPLQGWGKIHLPHLP